MKYLFFTPELGGMGGTQMFVYNKGLFLSKLGWEVCFCYFTKSEIKIKGIDSFRNYYLPESIWGIEHFSKHSVSKRIDDVITGLGLCADEETVIESNLMSLSFWAEILAERIRARHILNCLEENIPHYHKEVYKYLEFKLKRWECMNASEKSLKRTFKEHYIPEYLQYENLIKTPCSNVLTEEETIIDIQPYTKADYNIISIGRLDKPYIPKTISELIRICNAHRDKTFNVVFVGASKDGMVEKTIKEQLGKLNNVKAFFLGYMFPIPAALLGCMNVSIATSNSVLVSYNYGIPTIAVDAQDYDAIGIYGYNTTNKVFRKEEPVISVGEYLDKILFDKAFIYKKDEIVSADDSEEEFTRQLNYLLKFTGCKDYYPVQNLYNMIERIKGTIIRVLYIMKHSLIRV